MNIREKERSWRTAAFAAVTIALSGCLFVLAAAAFPGGDYNPCLRMLSALGRSEVRTVVWPASMFLFVAGMFVSALGVAVLARRLRLSRWGAALHVVGLVAIALVPENVCEIGHNAACWLAAIGGGLMLRSWWRQEKNRRIRLVWMAVLVVPLVLIGTGLALHAFRHVPFAPWVPTAQKGVIFAFAAWLFALSVRPLSVRGRCVASIAGLIPVAFALVLFVRPSWRSDVDVEMTASVFVLLPLCEDELAGLSWLEYVTGPLSEADEQEWWARGKPQYSIFSKRYNIAFAGYAAAAIG